MSETDTGDRTADPDHENVIDRVTEQIEQSRNLQQMNDPLSQVFKCLSGMLIKNKIVCIIVNLKNEYL